MILLREIKATKEINGDKGDKGDTGSQGPANTLSIGTVEKGEEAGATITGDSPNQTLNLTLPKGDKGDAYEITSSDYEAIANIVEEDISETLNNKVDKVEGKGLSTNDFTDTYKSNVDNNTSARHTHSNKAVLDNISSTDISNWNNKSTFSGNYNDLTNKPTIPDELADLSDDSTHRTVTDTEKTTWNSKPNFFGITTSLQESETSPLPSSDYSKWEDLGLKVGDFVFSGDFYDALPNMKNAFFIYIVSSINTYNNQVTFTPIDRNSIGRPQDPITDYIDGQTMANDPISVTLPVGTMWVNYLTKRMWVLVDYVDRQATQPNMEYVWQEITPFYIAGTGIAITNNVISSTLEGIDYEVDQQLPVSGEKGIIYLIPNSSSEQENIYDEYIWIPPLQEGETGRFEFIGSTQTDLTNYVQNTDYASNSKGGTFKTSANAGTYIDNGVLYPYIRNYNNYQNDNNVLFISKGTLENVIAGKELVNKTYVDGLVGDIDTALDTINGEVI